MIVLKPRALANEMKILRSLQRKMSLLQQDGKRHMHLEKGWQGEQRFDQLLMERLQNVGYLLHDLCLEQNHSVFQIDTLLISEKGILLFEIKNYEGDYVYGAENFRILPSDQEILNPLHQLNRSITLFRSLLSKLKIQLPVKGYIAFVNPQFTLYEAPVNAPIILPSQLHRFLERINQNPSLLSRQHRELADHLLEMHLPISPYARMPDYHFQHLGKGILCNTCHSFMIKTGRKIVCNKCGYDESVENSIMRSIEELTLLFPDQRITTSIIQQWCRIIDSRKTIRRVLVQNFQPVGSKKQRHYVIRT
ncbi:NERD domain-containing protein [Sporosarcina sp. 179-K 3D1 HS]|uniref:NERD domain-containing protein n=1 Tax=Sporosarcina sp. 179-K 3D1 HS TaxID=3232169 RepID=UPI00399F589F